MKKFIALTLSLMMVMSLVAVPVMAEDVAVNDSTATTTTVTYPTPTQWVSAATIEDYMDNGTGTIVGDKVSDRYGNKWNIIDFWNGNQSEDYSKEYGLYDISNPVWNYLRFLKIKGRHYSVYNEEKEGASNVTPWKGFRIDATVDVDQESSAHYANASAGLALGNTARGFFTGKDLRVDSVCFMMDEYDSDSWVSLLGLTTVQTSYASAKVANALRIANGGAYVKGLSTDGKYTAFIEDGTLLPDTWYRAERIIDTRVDGEVWARYMIFNNDTNELIKSTDWVKVESGATITTEYNTLGFAVGKFPADSFIYVDDIKSWAIDSPSGDAVIGAPTDLGHKWLTYPIPSAKEWLYNHAIGFSLKGSINPAIKDTGYPAAALTSNYIYLQEDFMIPEKNTTEFGLLDLAGRDTYNTTIADGGSGGGLYVGGILRVKNGVLTVKEWDGTTEFKAGSGTGWYNLDVKLKDGSDFALTLTPGEWYTATVKIDQSAYAGKITTDKDTVYIADSEGTPQLATNAQTTKATVVIEDSQGNKYETAEFTYKAPAKYCTYDSYGAVHFVDGKRSNTMDPPAGYKVSIDNVKAVLSNTSMDADDAVVFFDEDFDNRTTNATADTFLKANNLRLNLAVVEADTETILGLPSQVQITVEHPVSSDVEVLAEAITLNKIVGENEVDVSDQISAINYDADAKTLVVSLNALEPLTDYSLSIAREAATAEANIFSVIPSTTAYTFTTGYGDTGELIFEPTFVISAGGAEYNIEDEEWVGGIYFPGDIIVGSQSTLTSNNVSAMSYVAIAAVYDTEGKMEDMMSEVGTIAGNGTTINLFTDENAYLAPVVTDEIDGETKIVKSFIWNTWRLMKPIAKHYCYPAAIAE